MNQTSLINSNSQAATADGKLISGCLSIRQVGAVTLVGLNRPAKRNALNAVAIAEIQACFQNLPDDTRAVILYGEGEHFCSGLDLSGITSDPAEAFAMSRTWYRAFGAIDCCEVPVIALLHGAVIGGGLELAAAAHIRIAETNTYYALPEGMRGIFVGGGGAVRIPRLIGVPRMADMMLTGRTYTAEEGVRLGFSQYVVEPGRGLGKATELAERISANPRLSNFAIIHALPLIARSEPEAGLLLEGLMAAATVNGDEARKRAQAFLSGKAAKAIPTTGVHEGKSARPA
jgi:(methylthio)acryloyl-CoA hydratase